MALTAEQRKARAEEKAAAEAERSELQKQLGPLEIHEVTGVALDTSDPNYEQMKRIEDLKAEVLLARHSAIGVGKEQDEEVRQAALDREEARLKLELTRARAAANIGDGSGGGVDAVLSQLQEQREKDEAAAAEANKKEGN